jgi:hypothetical protein
MQVFCNLLQIIKGLPFNPCLGHISQFFFISTYLPNLNLNSVLFKNAIIICNCTEKKTRAMCCTTEIFLPPTKSVDSIHIGMNEYKVIFTNTLNTK